MLCIVGEKESSRRDGASASNFRRADAAVCYCTLRCLVRCLCMYNIYVQ